MVCAVGVWVRLGGPGGVRGAVAGVRGQGIILLSGVHSTERVYRAIGWTTVILVAALTPLSTAMQVTGAA